MSGKRHWRVLYLVVLLAVYPIDAMAYLDPGVGSLVIQGLIAALAAVGYAVRLYWTRIKSFFGRGGDATESRDDSSV